MPSRSVTTSDSKPGGRSLVGASISVSYVKAKGEAQRVANSGKKLTHARAESLFDGESELLKSYVHTS